MNDLSHWDFSADFTGAQAVALVFGLDLNDIQAKQSMGVLGADASAKFAPACERMKQCYDAARGYCHDSLRPPRDWDEKRPAVMLHSVELSRRIQELDPEFDHYLCNWLGDESYSGFDTQRFARSEIVAWLACIGQVSIYAFDGGQPTNPGSGSAADNESTIDPEDLPSELDCANQAFRAVSNGFGDPTATFKNRLTDYLEKTHTTLTQEAVKRIATVANPDKSPGRQKSSSK